MLMVYLAFGGAEQESDWMVISQLSFPSSTESCALLKMHIK